MLSLKKIAKWMKKWILDDCSYLCKGLNKSDIKKALFSQGFFLYLVYLLNKKIGAFF
ncbi:hypothetical protein BTHERMOSOX_1814 [Bathymodiolus thermophilus thioautotrophic gill symbiont]|nr:hypothetical protein BTHERMOSOX_1814 [Bathymodiolus thermophilus thioautotrophic gill symbiont]